MRIVFDIGDCFIAKDGSNFGVVVKGNLAIFIYKPNENYDYYLVIHAPINEGKENNKYEIIDLEDIQKNGSPEEKLMASMMKIAITTREII